MHNLIFISGFIIAQTTGNDGGNLINVPLFDEPIDASLFFTLCAVVIRFFIIHGVLATITAVIYRF